MDVIGKNKDQKPMGWFSSQFDFEYGTLKVNVGLDVFPSAD